MKAILFFAIICFVDYCCGQTPANDPHWVLEWSDDFNNNTPDHHNIPPNPQFWDINNNSDASQTGNTGGPVVWRNSIENVYIDENGYLTLKLIHENYFCPANDDVNCLRQHESLPNGGPYHYTSGLIHSNFDHLIQYGYFEVRAKVPGINGLWAALWLSGVIWGSNYPADTLDYIYNEIDVFEMDPYKTNLCGANFIHTHYIMPTNIWTDYKNTYNYHDNCTRPDSHPSVLVTPDYTQFHIYGIEWSPSRIIWYVDDIPVRYYENTPDKLHSITIPQSLIISLCIHEHRVGVNYVPDVNNNELPQEMKIDWVRCYALMVDGDNFINTTNYNFSSYNNREKSFIKIGEGGGNNSLSPGDDIKLRASQYIEISGKFEVPFGARFFADVDKSCNTNLGIQCTETFNPCEYVFSGYDNAIKKAIDLGGNSCTLTITPGNDDDILLHATDEILLKPGVIIIPNSGKFVELKIVPCF